MSEENLDPRMRIGLACRNAMKNCAIITLITWVLTIMAIVMDSEVLAGIVFYCAAMLPFALMLALTAKRYSNGTDTHYKYIRFTLYGSAAYIALIVIAGHF